MKKGTPAAWSQNLPAQQMLVLKERGSLPHYRWPSPDNPIPAGALDAALERCPTLIAALVYLARRHDSRPRTKIERAERNVLEEDVVRYVVGETVAFALKWVHDRCTWETPRNGAELWDYVANLARDDSVAEVKDIVVPRLRALDSPGTRRDFWSELLSRFPSLVLELPAEGKRRSTDLASFNVPVKVADAAKIINKRSDLVLNELRRASCKTTPKGARPAYAEHEDLCKLFPRYKKKHQN